MRDQNLTKITTLPAANASSAPAGLDTNCSPVVGDVSNNAFFRIACPATPNLANGTTITWTIQDSADNSSWAAVPGVATHVTTGAGGTGAAAFDVHRPIPRETRRYVRCIAAVANSGGDSTAVSYTFSVDLHPIR